MNYNIIIWQNKRKKIINVNNEENLLEILRNRKFSISSPCGGKGICSKCKVRFLSGLPEASFREKEVLTIQEINAGYRLACMHQIKQDVEIELDDELDFEVLTNGLNTLNVCEAEVKKFYMILSKPTLNDQRDYLKKITDRILFDTISLSALKKLESIDKNKGFTITLKGKKIIEVESENKSESIFGIAADIGTTTVVLYLIDINKGQEIDIYTFHNPQNVYGADVISRIDYTIQHEDGIKKLKECLLNRINEGILKLTQRNSLEIEDILMMSIVGNTIMLHTLLGINAQSIALAPYIPLFTKELELSPNEIGVEINKNGLINILPSISGYIGSDIVGDMIAVGYTANIKGWFLLIDIGTNGELVLGNGERFFACSTAAGPAFEGMNITFGMAGIKGAISEYGLEAYGSITYKCVRNGQPKGICGSGLLDIVAELYENGFLTKTGRFCPEQELSKWQIDMITRYKEQKAFMVLRKDKSALNMDILLTQKDISEILLAKAAISAGIKILVKDAGIDYETINKVYLSGGFGNFLNPHNACKIGMIPQELEEKILRIGNGAGMGAKLYLMDKKQKKFAKDLIKKVKYIELSSRSDFQMEFLNSIEIN